MKRKIAIIIPLFLLSSCGNIIEERYFTIKWCNFDNTILEIDEKVKEGDIPSFDKETPSKASDDIYDYSFSNWDKEIKPAYKDETYIATYIANERIGIITPSHPSGFYAEDFELSLSAPKGFEIYYSLDNTDPDESSTKYESPLEIKDVSNNPNYYSLKQNISSLDVYYPEELVDKCNLIKAIAINKETHKKSDIYYFNYFVGFNNKDGYSLPIINLNVNEDDLYDYEKGIYVTGKIYDESEHTGYPETYPANYHQKGKDWERFANFKYFSEDKELELEQNIGIRIHGGWSRAFNQKSFNLYARKEYSGTSTFSHKFFNDINSHSLMLRSGGYRDTTLTKLRDSLNQDMSINESFDIQRSKPTILFLNGEYWGIYNLQERFSDNYIEEHHNINKKNVLIIKNDEIDEGREEDYHYYEDLISFFQNNTFESEEKLNEARTYIDFDEFASYMSTQLYVGNIDWPGNNVRVWKDVSDSNSKWHFMMYDTDDSSAILSYKCGVDIDPFLKSSHWKSGPLEETCLLGLMLSKLIANESFKTLFRDTFMRIGSENFSSTRVLNYLDEKQSLLRTPMVNSYKRFVNSTYNETYFDSKVEIIKSFFHDRYPYAIDFLNNHIPD